MVLVWVPSLAGKEILKACTESPSVLLEHPAFVARILNSASFRSVSGLRTSNTGRNMKRLRDSIGWPQMSQAPMTGYAFAARLLNPGNGFVTSAVQPKERPLFQPPSRNTEIRVSCNQLSHFSEKSTTDNQSLMTAKNAVSTRPLYSHRNSQKRP